VSTKTPFDFDALFLAATAPVVSDAEWKSHFVALYQNAEASEAEYREKIIALETELAAARKALTVSPRNLESSIAAAAQSLAELTGEACHVEFSAWYHPDHYTAPKLRTTYTAYRSGQVRGSFEGATLEYAVAKVRENWERAQDAAAEQYHRDNPAVPAVDPATETDRAAADMPY
jgi:hypothetical protein